MPAVMTGSYRERAVRVAASGLLAVTAMSAGACYAGSGTEQVDPAAFSWNAPASPPSTVYLKNTNGSIEVKSATDGNLRVTAAVRWKQGDPKRDLKFETVNGTNGVTICALWGGGTCSASAYESSSRGLTKKLMGRTTDANVAFTVYVPTGVKVDAFTMNGSIGVAATAPVLARTMNGTIKVATSVGPVDAETVNGNVDVRMTTLGADGPVRAHSVNGSVSAYLPEKFDGTVEMSTVLGRLTSDFSGGVLPIEEKKFSAALGTGGRKVDIGTVTGEAALHKLNANGVVVAP